MRRSQKSITTTFIGILIFLLGAAAFGQVPTTTTLTVLPSNTVNDGQSVTLTAVVGNGGAAATPTPTVTFYDGTTAIGTASLDGTGTGTLTTTALPVGSNSLTAVYGGDSNNVQSTSAATVVTVNSPMATITPASSAFGTVAVGMSSAPQAVAVTVNNTSLVTLDPIAIGNLSFSSPAFAEATADTPTNTCSGGVAGGASCSITLNVVFSPTASGAASGTLSLINVTAGGSPVAVSGSVSLSGTGYLPTVSAQLMGQIVTLTNQLSTPLTFTPTLQPSTIFTIQTTGAEAGTCPFSTTAPFTITLSGGSCTINITAGTAGTQESAQLTVTYAGTITSTPIQVSGSPLTIGEPGTGGGTAIDSGLQQVVQLTAGPTTYTAPDGNIVPMWGYTCGAAVSGSGATCRALNPNPGAGWSPVVITVPTGQQLEIELTNGLTFLPAGKTTPNNIPTSLVIVGQVGGGLGNSATYVPSPAHVQQPVTWPVAHTGGEFSPPPQPARVQSFATEVAAGTGAPVDLIWPLLRPGTYLLESGTHPSIQIPMGLIGVVIVTAAPNATAPGTAYPGVIYNADIPLELSEIDPGLNNAVSTAVNTAGFSSTAVRDPYLAPGPIVSTFVTNGGAGYAIPPALGPTVKFSGGGCTSEPIATANVSINGSVTSLTVSDPGAGCTSDPSVSIAASPSLPANPVNNATAEASLALGTNSLNHCSGGFAACYPPAVNYTPLYYLINGVAFNKTNPLGSLFNPSPATSTAAPITGTMLVRLVNAGLRMHLPSLVGTQTTGFKGDGTSATTTVNGFSIIAEDGNRQPGVPKVQSDIFMPAGKTNDVMINVPPCTPAAGTTCPNNPAIAVFDRELSLSGNAINRDSGMLAYIGINGASAPSGGTGGVAALGAANAVADVYNSVTPGQTLTVSDPSKGVLANDFNVFGAKVTTLPTKGTVTLNLNGSFTYVANATWATSDQFTYCGNGATTGTACATVTLNPAAAAQGDALSCLGTSFTSTVATYLAIKTPGVLAGCTDSNKLPFSVVTASPVSYPTGQTALSVIPDATGGFTATATSAGSYSFSVTVKNSVGTTTTATATVAFPTGSGLVVNVLDGADKTTTITDYRWVIEEDQTFYIDPACIQNPPAASCNTQSSLNGIVPTLGVNFHTSHMPFVAQGCTGTLSCEGGQTAVDNNPASATYGQHLPVVCDVGNGVCRPDTTGNGFTWVMPAAVNLDPTKRYYISILPGDAAQPFASGFGGPDCQNGAANANGAPCGHGMGGAPIAALCAPHSTSCPTGYTTPITVLTQPAPYPPSKLSVFVFEDDFPLNGEQDGGGGVDVLGAQEPGLGNFQIHLWDAMGGDGDFTGQMSYDMFNQPLSNSLAGTVDPVTGLNACPIDVQPTNTLANGGTDPTATGITGMIVTCPRYEADGKTLSPLAGQAVIMNLMPGRFSVIATAGADRIARGEEWLQTNTLDGQKGHDAFLRIGEPSYFQEFGPAGYHVSIGFANPAIINGRKPYVCNGTDANITGNCNPGNTVTGRVVGQRLSRTPDERLYGSGSRDTFYWTQCFVSFGDPDGEDFAFTKCADDGTFTLTGLPDGDWRLTTFDQWNDQLVDGLSTPVRLGSSNPNDLCHGAGSSQHVCNMGDIAATQWQTNIYSRVCSDENGDGICQTDEAGLAFLVTSVRKRDGSMENILLTDSTGTANFNETFPLFSWYTVETDATRYKNTGTHVVYDVGGPADGTCGSFPSGYPPCGNSVIGKYRANTAEQVSLPTNLRVPGSVYCANADCTGYSVQNGPGTSAAPSVCTTSNGGTVCSTQLSSGRIDNPWYGAVEGWQGFPGQNSFIEFGKEPYAPGENGGIKGHVIYASTRPFDDPQQLVQTQWEPLVPHVGINLYQEGFGADGVTPTLTLVDHTQTSSFDDWAQGFHVGPDGHTMIPNMNCPGQGAGTGVLADPFFFSLEKQPNYLDLYNNVLHGTATAPTPLPYNSQFKCYDGMHNWNQLQPAPYDGMYQFPSITTLDPTTGKPGGTYNSTTGLWTGTSCTICKPNTTVAPTDLYYGLPMLPAGKYVVEVVVPPGFELVKEEDKNILIGDNFIAPVTQEFGGLGNIFILPDQASVATGYSGPGYNPFNAQNSTQSLGEGPTNWIVPGFVPEPIWPCVGEARVVPDFISLFPQSGEVAPFAGSTRNLCDRKEVTLSEQTGAIAKFYLYTSTHVASKFTGGITDDYTSEFDPFSPQFGEKFAPPDLPVSVKDWAGNEIGRTYADHWGAYDGMVYSTWEVNPPNPTGYSPNMMVLCMNDPGPIPGPGGTMVTDPLFTQGYSQFCYELPFMPATTTYLDTPVVPTSAFAGAGYNNVDCSYPDATPAVSEVDGDSVGPWVAAGGNTLTITALPDQQVMNYAYSGPSATTAPYNQKYVTRHFGFGVQCTTPTPGSATCNTASSVSIGGQSAAITGWSDTQITVNVPTTGVLPCPIQQQVQYRPGVTSSALCGQLLITAGNGKQSIDTVTVTIGGKPPIHVPASATIQSAIDAAAPGDLIIVDPTCNAATGSVNCTTAGSLTPGITGKTTSNHNELVIMWKPVRLQGVGAASTIINANTHPAGKLDPWRQKVNCLFGIALDGQPISATNSFDPTGGTVCGSTNNVQWAYFNPYPGTGAYAYNPQVDRLPLEATLGWDANLNGNLAELLQEPSLMGALEGPGILVLSKGVNFPSNPFDPTLLAGFPTGTTLLTGTGPTATGFAKGDASPLCHTSSTTDTNPFPSNFMCNPSSIDGLGITNSSQGGGAIFVHAWAHYLQIANNRIYNNAGTLSGGINVGQGEFPGAYTVGGGATNAAPSSCETTGVTGQQLAYCHNLFVNVHNNNISLNSSTGDELFSATPAGAGGVSFCTGADYYKFNFNWVCGNLTSGDGGGFGHLGFSKNADIEHNTIVFNQSLNPTIPANGGGMVIMGTPDADPTCGANTDADCVPAPTAIGPSDGVGPGMFINANLIMGNAAESGTGGGVAFRNVNGADVIAFPNSPALWHHIVFQNNIVANNVAGWDGAGISLLDALNTDIVNNTIASNSTTATAGILFTTIGAPVSSSGGGDISGNNCTSSTTTSCPQPAGIVSVPNSIVFAANLPAQVTCPAGHGYGGSGPLGLINGSCKFFSSPLLTSDVFWQNSAYYIGVAPMSPQFQQDVVTLFNAFTTTPVGSQTQTDTTSGNGQGGTIITGGSGACLTGSSYWDLGVRGDTGPGNHANIGTFTTAELTPIYSVLTNPSENGNGSNNFLGLNPAFNQQYCNGARTPPEFGASGWAVPPGISDATVPNPLFNLTPVATVDEGNNWINLRWGPLSLTNPTTTTGPTSNFGSGPALGNYTLASASPAIDRIPTTVAHPTRDFFGNPRPDPAVANRFDVGAVEFQGTGAAFVTVSPTTLNFTAVVGTPSGAQTLTLTNTGTSAFTGLTLTFTSPFSRATGPNAGSCASTLAANSSCTIGVVFTPSVPGAQTGNVTLTGSVPVNGSPLALTGTGVAPVNSASLIPTTWTPTANRGVGAGSPRCLPTGSTVGPCQVFMLTNTGNVSLTGITQATIGGANAADWSIVRVQSSCGPAGGGQVVSTTTLAVGASCVVTMQFLPRATDTAGTSNATVSVTDSAGTQTSTLTGTITYGPLTLTPSPFNNLVGHTSVTTFYTVTLTGTAGTPITSVGFTGTNAADFSRPTGTAGGTCGATIPAAGTCTIVMAFRPLGTGARTATLNVTDGITVTDSLAGTGVTP